MQAHIFEMFVYFYIYLHFIYLCQANQNELLNFLAYLKMIN
jgi:hypothetical protein